MPYRLGLPLGGYPYGPAARFTLTGIQPPASSYLAPSDSLSLSILSPNFPVSFNLALRFLDLQGNVQPLLFEVRAPATGATPLIFPVQTSEGFLLSVTASTTTVERGCCWIQLLVLRTNAADATVIGDALLQGYVSQTDIVSYPGTQEKTSIGGRGCTRTVIVPAPGAGSPVVLTVPPATRWHPIGIFVVTATGAGTTQPVARFIDAAGNEIGRYLNFHSIDATPRGFSWGMATFNQGFGVCWAAGIAQELYLTAGAQLRLDTGGSVALNQDPTAAYGDTSFLVEEWVQL